MLIEKQKINKFSIIQNRFSRISIKEKYISVFPCVVVFSFFFICCFVAVHRKYIKNNLIFSAIFILYFKTKKIGKLIGYHSIGTKKFMEIRVRFSQQSSVYSRDDVSVFNYIFGGRPMVKKIACKTEHNHFFQLKNLSKSY